MLERLSKQNGFPIIQYIIFIHCLWIIYFRVVKECLIYFFHIFAGDMIVLERTVQCLWTVQFFGMFDMFEVQFWAKMRCSEVFEVRSGCYVTRLFLEHTVWCLRTGQFFVMFEVRFSTKMWCSESSMFGHSMFGVFEVRYFGVCSKTSFD